jgi:hypothetical protein
VKEVLSANAEYPVKAEQLHDETDLNTKITRYRTKNILVVFLLFVVANLACSVI